MSFHDTTLHPSPRPDMAELRQIETIDDGLRRIQRADDAIGKTIKEAFSGASMAEIVADIVGAICVFAIGYSLFWLLPIIAEVTR